ncbi:MAG: pyridoxal phosphate-dependent aminotransferase, partial [Patescibacteria group bacterium]
KYRGPQVPYAPSPGFRDHVEAWLRYYRTLGVSLKLAELIPTVGCAEAIMYAMMAVTDPGDEVLVFEPFYPSYKSFAKMIGVNLRPVTLSLDNNYALPSENEILARVTSRTKAIAVINPGNPTGAVLTPAEQARIARIAKKKNLFIIADETYRDILFSGKPTSMLSISEVRDRVIAVDSASKRFSLPGARIGCVISRNTEVMAAVLRFCQARLSAGTLEQFGLVPLLKNHRSYVRAAAREYKKRHDVAVRELRKIPGVTVHPAKGAFYLTVGLPVRSSEDFTAFMLKDFARGGKTVAVAPMPGFYWTRGLGVSDVRIAFVLNGGKMREAIRLLGHALVAYSGR